MSSVSVGGGTSVYIRQPGPTTYQYSTDQVIWTGFSWPLTVSNTTSPSTAVIIVFTTDITLTTPNDHFICGSGGIQFGIQTRDSDGSRPVITISGVSVGYPGLVQNGTSFPSSGFNNITIYNLVIDGTTSVITPIGGGVSGGWVGQAYFGQGITGVNRVVNCSSIGHIIGSGGGILGSYVANNASGQVYVTGCNSSGVIGDSAGGICGTYCSTSGTTGTVTIARCSSSGTIGIESGGIVGNTSGNNGSLIITNCYSTGTIGSLSGGIAARYSNATVSQCYSEGSIGNDAGGIFGNSCSGTASNCYSKGTVTDPLRGIFGSSSSGTATNCYVPNGPWIDTNAIGSLLGFPSSTPYGTVWCQPDGLNTSYSLSTSDYSPYSLTLVDTFTRTVAVGGASTPAAVIPDYTFQILEINGALASTVPTITLNATTGVIQTTSATPAGIYTLRIYSTKNPYGVTEYALIVQAEPPPPPTPTPVTGCCPTPVQLQDIDYTTRTEVKRGVIIGLGPRNPSAFASYNDYIAYKLTKSFLRN